MQSTLVLNASYEPLSIVSARRAVQLLVAQRAISVSDSNRAFHSATGEIALPWVIRLNHFVRRPTNVRQAKFSRRGVMVRDGYTCVYCGKHAETIDHVVPRTYGGLSTYENCVAACVHCNRKKGHKTLAELNWSLPVVPKTPTPLATMLGLAHRNDEQLAAWGEYIIMFQPELAPLLSKPVAIPVGG